MCPILAAALLAHRSRSPPPPTTSPYVKRGEVVPACKLAALDGSVVDSEAMKGSVIVYVCLSAEQKHRRRPRSTRQAVVAAMNGEPVKLVHVTADVVQRAYFEKLRRTRTLPRAWPSTPTAPVLCKARAYRLPHHRHREQEDGKLDNAISLHGNDYKPCSTPTSATPWARSMTSSSRRC